MIIKSKFRRCAGVEDEIKALSANDYCYINNSPVVQNVFHVHLTTEIAEAKDYRELFHLLRTAYESDNFIFYMNNYGGQVHTAIEIINSIKASHANVICVVSGPIYSAAPLIALSCNKIYLENNSFFMFHDYSGGAGGKGSEMEKSIAHYQPFFKQFFEQTCKGFLTKKEMNNILSGQDLYVDKPDTSKRLKKIGRLGE